MTNKKNIAVYGAGVSGLIAAYYLVKKGFDVDVIDPFDDVKIQTLKTPEGIVELAANSILVNDSAKELFKDIGIEYQAYFKEGEKKFVFLDGKLKRWPLSILESLTSIPSLLKLAKKKKVLQPKKGESLKAWADRCISKAVFEKLLVPALQGVYGGNPETLSASLVLNNFFEKPKTYGSVSFKDGMGAFIASLKYFLLNMGVAFIEEEEMIYDHYVVSSPAHSLPERVSKKNKMLLASVAYKKVSTVTLFVDESDKMPFSGFGSVFKDNKAGVLGLILNSNLFDGRAKTGLVSETWILDGEKLEEEEDALEAVYECRAESFNRKNTVEAFYHKYWEKAFPDYNLNLEDVLNSLESEESTDFFANWTGALGMGSMIHKGKDFADHIESKLGGTDV